MDRVDAHTAAEQTGCKIIPSGLTLRALTQLLQSAGMSEDDDDVKTHLFADFTLGQRLEAIAVIGTRAQLNQLKLELEL